MYIQSRFILSHTFSLYTKIPKEYQPKQAKSWFQKIFSQPENSPTFILLHELYNYLQNTEFFMHQFPFLNNTQRMCENNMLVHACLLRDRLAAQPVLPRSEIQKFNYNIQNSFFPDYAAFINPNIPANNFKQHYAEAYMKKLQIFNQEIKQYEFGVSSNRFISSSQYAPLFRKLIYENRLNIENNELIKYCKYFYAHKKYLTHLPWDDLITYKVKWGFQDGKLLGQINLK